MKRPSFLAIASEPEGSAKSLSAEKLRPGSGIASSLIPVIEALSSCVSGYVLRNRNQRPGARPILPALIGISHSI